MPVKLTESAISKATKNSVASGVRAELADAGCPGLRLRIAPSGHRNWVLTCRDRHGRMRRFAVGDYIDMGIAEARAEARALRVKVREEGVDPVLEKKRDRAIGAAAKAGEGTLKAVLDLYEAKHGCTLKSWEHSRKRVDRVFRFLMDRPVAALTAADFQMLADAYPSSNSAAFAVRTIRPALKWCAAPGRAYVKMELAALSQPPSAKPRKRFLSREELARVLPVLRQSERPHAHCMIFLVLTLTRLNEAALARWAGINMVDATLTIVDPKNGETHVVPLSRQALALLEDMRPDAVKPDELIFKTSVGSALGNWDRETKTIHAASNTSLWHRHDLRRTAATMLGEMGVLPDIVEATLNHTSIHSALAATYNRSRYRPQVAEALQRLADALDDIEAGTAKVVPIKRPA